MNSQNLDTQKALEIIAAFNGETDYNVLLNVILNKMMEMTGADAGTLYVLDDDKLHFHITSNKTLNTFQDGEDKINLPPIALDENNIENVSAYSALKNEVVSVEDVYSDSRFNFAGPKNYDKMTGYRTKSMLVFPLSAVSGENHQEVIGVIQLINAIDKETGGVISFDEACDRDILLSISAIAAGTLANIVYADEIAELFDSFVRVMTTAIDERSVYNKNHTNNVARMCEKFCRHVSSIFPPGHDFHFDKHRRDQLVMAALLHDVGKIITPLSVMDKTDRLGSQMDAIRYRFEIKKYQIMLAYGGYKIDKLIYEERMRELEDALALIEEINTLGFLSDEKVGRLNKLSEMTYTDSAGNIVPVLTEQNIKSLSVRKGTLTDDERKIMQEHVLITGRLLESMKFSKYYSMVPVWAGSHHEFSDGSGYPDGLSDDEIPVEVSILSIIDIFDALVASDRPYKRSMPNESAFTVLRNMADEGKLRKDLVELFIGSGVCGSAQEGAV